MKTEPRADIWCGFAALLAVSMFAPLAAGPCWAEPSTQPATRPSETPDAAPNIKSLFADLASADAAARDAALVRLMGLKADDLPELKHVVEESRPLLPAQATVLREVVTQVYLSGMPYEANATQGFLGISLDTALVSFRDAENADGPTSSTGIVVVKRMPGFVGARMLRDGDVILSIVERPEVALRLTTDLSTAVKDMGPGATVHFELLRQGQVIRVAIKLDARPFDPDPFGGGITNRLLDERRRMADLYWSASFAALVKEGVS